MATINTGPAAVDTGATTITPIGPLDRAPGAVPPASDPGIPTAPPVYNRPVDRAPEPVEPGVGTGINTTATATPSIPVIELPVEEAAPAGAGASVPAATPIYIKVLSDGTVVTENTIALNFLGTGVTVAANGSTANITITAGGASYGNSNVVSLMSAFGSNTISTTGNITGGYILGNGSQLTGLPATYGNSNVATLLGAFGSNSISTTGNITGGNISAPDGNGSILINRSGVIGAAAGFSYDTAANAMFVPEITASGNSTTGINAIYGGVSGYVVLGSSVMAQFTGNVNAYSQINFQNINNGTRASGDYIITANNGTDSTYYLDLGLAGSNHADPAFFGDTTTRNDGYLYVTGNAQSGPSGGVGNLILGSTNGTIKMFVGNTAQANVIATVSSTGVSVVGNVTAGNIAAVEANVTDVIAYNVNTVNINARDSSGINISANGYNNLAVEESRVIVQNVPLSVVGNVVSGNILTGGLISATANVTGGNLLTAGIVSATGNVTGGNVLTGGLISATANVTGGNVTTAGLTSTGSLSITGNTATITTANYAIGYRDIPQVSLSSNVTTALTDAGKHYYSTSASNLSLTIANNTSVSWPVGTAISIVNRGTANITIAPDSGVSLYLAGNSTSANRTVTTYGMATVMNVAANVWMINGTVV